MKKMKKIYTLLLFLFFHSYFCQAQPPDGNDDNRVQVVKMAYMTQELNLSPQEAQNFWPVYNIIYYFLYNRSRVILLGIACQYLQHFPY